LVTAMRSRMPDGRRGETGYTCACLPLRAARNGP
jgi:hypothetical protein